MLHEFIGDETINLARHELGHAFLGHALGYHVHGIELDEGEGRTELIYPLSLEQFEQRGNLCRQRDVDRFADDVAKSSIPLPATTVTRMARMRHLLLVR